MEKNEKGQEKKERVLTCTDCGVLNCRKRTLSYPEFCLTTGMEEGLEEYIRSLYEEEENKKVAIVSAEVEGEFARKYVRVEETLEFARRMGYKKIGIATCAGLIQESRIFAQILRKNDFEPYGIACKVGAFNKTDLGLDPKYTRLTGNAMCNPILQAELLNRAGTDMNVVIGLCVGHDSLFYKYSKAITTTLIVKDRILGHNPVMALYQAKDGPYRRLLGNDWKV